MTDIYTVVSIPDASGSSTNTIIIGSGIEGASVIDPVAGDPAHLEAIINAAEHRGGIRRALVTRGHADCMKGARILCQKLGVHIFAWSYKGAPFANYKMPDGMQVPAGAETLRAIHTPGQSNTHLCFFLERSRVLFTGDLLAESATVVMLPKGKRSDYLQSLRRLQQLDIQEIVPAHGPVIRNPQAHLAEYIAHCLA
jgi:glyoxylase-like metal-dependent hydrolase (beta-lactamase superfamily II)